MESEEVGEKMSEEWRKVGGIDGVGGKGGKTRRRDGGKD